MIPPRIDLEALGYEGHDIDRLLAARRVVNSLAEERRADAIRAILKELWPDERERFQKTSWITNKDGRVQYLKLNYAQERFWEQIIEPSRRHRDPVRAIVLKGRQLGYSTLIQCLHYFWCYEHPNRNAMTISYDDPSSRDLFFKAWFCNDVHWAKRPVKQQSQKLLRFEHPHNSTFYVDTAGNERAGRGKTFQHLHCSEIPMWTNPEPVIAAAHNAVPRFPFTTIIWESTAKGQAGPFYRQWCAAEEGEGMTPFFAPWFWDPKYRTEFRTEQQKATFVQRMSREDATYMRKYKLSLEQMLWRADTIREEFTGKAILFRQEYPATPHEAFLASGSPVFNGDRIDEMLVNCCAPELVGEIGLLREDA